MSRPLRTCSRMKMSCKASSRGLPLPALAGRGKKERSRADVTRALRRRDDLEIVAWRRHGAERVVDVPLVLHLGGVLGAHRVHLHHHLVVVGAEIALARPADVELRALAQMLGEL